MVGACWDGVFLGPLNEKFSVMVIRCSGRSLDVRHRPKKAFSVILRKKVPAAARRASAGCPCQARITSQLSQFVILLVSPSILCSAIPCGPHRPECAPLMGGVFDLMGDEDGSQELPQRSRDAARGGSDRSAPSVSPALSEELRQRIHAAVKAERAEAAAKEGSAAPEGSGRQTRSAPAASAAPAPAPAVNGTGGARKRERAAKPEPKAKPDAQPERAAKDGTRVRLQPPATRPRVHKPAPRGHARTAVRGRTSRSAHPAESVRKKPRDWHLAQVGLAVLALALVATGSLVAAATFHFGSSPSGNSGPTAAALQRQEATTRSQAASWVVQQVSQDDSVSCDQVMCAALRAARFPASKLLVLGPASQPQLTSAVVVVTQVVRDLFGSSIDSAWAPAVLASFGDGAAEVSIRVVAPHGAVTYSKQLNSGQADRALHGKSLEAFPRITF